jgi:hypothetical protein
MKCELIGLPAEAVLIILKPENDDDRKILGEMHEKKMFLTTHFANATINVVSEAHVLVNPKKNYQ